MSYDKLGRSEFYNNFSAKDRVQDINLNQLKLKVNESYKKDENLKTNFEPSNIENVISKTCLDTNLSKMEGQISNIEEDYTEFKLHHNKQSVEDNLFDKTVKTNIQILSLTEVSLIIMILRMNT